MLSLLAGLSMFQLLAVNSVFETRGLRVRKTDSNSFDTTLSVG